MRWVMSRPNLWVPAAVLLGLGLRGYHYARCPSVWQDEAALATNVLRLSVTEMFGPLLHAEAAPPLFLVAERAVVGVLGDGVYALRLLPFLASCLGLLLFAGLAARLLGPRSGGLAVGLFAVSDRLLWHACEAKPYSLDVLVAVAAAWWYVRTEGRDVWRRCLPPAVVAPFALWLSFPACFVAGGLLVGLLPAGLRAGWGGRVGYAALAVAVGGAFLALALGPAAAQRCGAMDSCWVTHFPNYDRPATIPGWVVAQTVDIARYGLYPLGQPFALFVAVGARVVWHAAGGRALVAVLLLPLALALVAAFLHKYPYGGSRVEAFAAPAVCLLSAVGARHLLSIAGRRSRVRVGACVLVLGAPFAVAAFRVVVVWPRPAADAASAFVRERLAPGDRVVANHWEYEYYLRDEPGFRLWEGQLHPTETAAGRVWVIHTTHHTPGRFPFPLPPGWEVVGRTPFHQTAVFLLRPPAPRPSPG